MKKTFEIFLNVENLFKYTRKKNFCLLALSKFDGSVVNFVQSSTF